MRHPAFDSEFKSRPVWSGHGCGRANHQSVGSEREYAPFSGGEQTKPDSSRQGLESLSRFPVLRSYEESGIRFEHRPVDDAAKNYKAVHYDHGNGLAVADVDGDGRPDIYFVNQIGGNQLWRNLGGGKFENITAAAGVGLEDNICVTASFAAMDNDGWADL